jgi:hypothetical protein
VRSEDDANRLLTLRVIWVAFLIAPFMYLALGLTVLRESTAETWETSDTYTLMRIILTAVSVSALTMQAAFGPLLRRGRARANSPKAVFQFMAVELIVRCAMIEAVAILGLVLFILYGNVIDILLFGVASIAFMPLGYPRLPDADR